MTEPIKAKNPIPKNFQKKPENIITNAKGKVKGSTGEVQVIGELETGAIGTSKVKKQTKEQVKKNIVEVEKVAIHSTRNVSWPGVGKVSKGYNIVTRETADKWLTRDHIREATPQEVAQEFGL